MNLLGLDVGQKRIGMALANDIAKMPSPLNIVSPELLLQDIGKIIDTHSIQKIVVGLPRSLAGNETEQTHKIRAFADDLQRVTSVPIEFADESLTSLDARSLLTTKKKYKGRKYYDDLSACYILEEYLRRNLH